MSGDSKREREIAVAWLHEHGAVYVRAVFGMRSGWWFDGVFLGSRSIEAMENMRRKVQGEQVVEELEENIKRLTGDEEL